MSAAKVAVLRTSTRHVLADYHRLMNLAGYRDVLASDAETALLLHASQAFFFPGTVSPPWQLEGVVRTLKRDGFNSDRITVCQGRGGVADVGFAERESKQLDVVRAHGLKNAHLGRDELVALDAVASDLGAQLRALPQLLPHGIALPKRVLGMNVVHLPTLKSDAISPVVGALASGFFGLIEPRRRPAAALFHEALVEILVLQKRLFRGLLGVMDGTFALDGMCARGPVPHVKNVILASQDLVALDAVAAHLMGRDPLRDVPSIAFAHERGAGTGDLREIEILGDVQIMEERFANEEAPRKRTRPAPERPNRRYPIEVPRVAPKPEKHLLAPLTDAVASAYYSAFAYPKQAKVRLRKVLSSEWGRLFANWGRARSDVLGQGFQDVGVANPDVVRGAFAPLVLVLRRVGRVVFEPAEWRRRRRPRRAA